MAGLTWFELDIDFHEHPKTVALEVALKNPLAEAYVSRIWAYCYHHVTDRFEGEVGVATIERAARWKGKAGGLVEVLVSVGFLDRDGDALVAHGVAERLGPHLANREKAAARQAKRRKKVSEALRSVGGDVTRDAPRDVARESPSYPYKDRDQDTDRDRSEITKVSDPPPSPLRQPPAGGARLEALRGRLAEHFGLPEVGVGRAPDRVAASFDRWLRLPGGEDAVYQACIDFAAEKHETPSNLSWFPGFLDTVPARELERIAAWWAANPTNPEAPPRAAGGAA